MTDLPTPPRKRRRVLRIALWTALGLVVLLVLGVAGLLGYAMVASDRSVTLPAPTGPDRVGRVDYDWTDPTRIDPYAPDHTSHRELSVVVWYPADPPPAAPPASYQPPGWQEALGNGNWLGSLARMHTDRIQPHAVQNAPVAGGTTALPVLVFGPGLGLQATDYTSTAEDLASHGYLVAGVNPTYSTDVVLSGGRVVRSVPQARDDADDAGLTEVWAADLSFVVGRVAALDTTPGSPFQHRLDTGRIGLFGHSLGGAAATLACAHEPTCVGAMDLDGYLWGDVLRTGVGKPFAFLGNENSLATDGTQVGMLRQVTRNVPPADRHLWSVTGAEHFDFSDRGTYFNLLGSQIANLGPIDGVRAVAITRAYVGAFFDTYLRGRPAALLTGANAAFPEVRVG